MVFVRFQHTDFCVTIPTERQESGGDLGTNEADLFDISVDKELAKPSRSGPGRGQMGRSGANGGAPNIKRQKKNEKYGFGGKKRHSKSGDAMSSGDLSGFNPQKMKGRVGKAPRLGKSRRKALSSK
jgi:rRNA-processing protein EBP2